MAVAFLLTVLFSPYTAEYTPQTFNFAIVIFTGVVRRPSLSHPASTDVGLGIDVDGSRLVLHRPGGEMAVEPKYRSSTRFHRREDRLQAYWECQGIARRECGGEERVVETGFGFGLSLRMVGIGLWVEYGIHAMVTCYISSLSCEYKGKRIESEIRARKSKSPSNPSLFDVHQWPAPRMHSTRLLSLKNHKQRANASEIELNSLYQLLARRVE